MMKPYYFMLLLGLISLSCSNDIGEINDLTIEKHESVEVAEEVSILYSDSAEVKVKLNAPVMVRHVDRVKNSEEFPEGIFIEFLDERGNATSWLEADHAIRDDEKDVFVVRGNVKFYNTNQDALESTELTWHEKEQYIDTDKFVRIVQPNRGDTSYGYGFKTNQEFTLFEIKRKTSAKFNISRLKSSTEKK